MSRAATTLHAGGRGGKAVLRSKLAHWHSGGFATMASALERSVATAGWGLDSWQTIVIIGSDCHYRFNIIF